MEHVNAYKFMVDVFTKKEASHTYKVMVLEACGKDVAEAYASIKSQIPEGHRVWSWYGVDGNGDYVVEM